MEGSEHEEDDKPVMAAVSEQELELSRNAKDAFDGHRYVAHSQSMSHAALITMAPGMRAVCLLSTGYWR